MKVTYIQTQLHWEDREKNLSHFDTLINSIKEETQLILLPEMFTTGFSMHPKKTAEPANGITLKWMQQKAKEKNAVICGSVAVKDRENYFNRLFWVMPNGEFHTYNKRHLFSMGKENEHFKAGAKKLIAQLGEWKVCPLVCYDLRFPVWSRNKFKSKVKSQKHALSAAEGSAVSSQQSAEGAWDYDVLIYVANWPEARVYPWKQLLIARAIENQCYVIGVNRIGKDGNGISHAGESLVIDPKGTIVSKANYNQECVETIALDKLALDEFRTTFPVGRDADEFSV
ncbi:MAG: nitrilase family protein [Bacteroidia bacterium]|nr:nitrilase family protein [Bacteroidia bacterium]